MRCRTRDGLTLVELLVVVSIIGLVMAVLLPSIQSARESARRTKCQNNFRQIAIAAAAFQSSQGPFPPGTLNPYCGDDSTKDDNRTWFQFLLPHLGQESIYNALENYRVAGGPMDAIWYVGASARQNMPTVTCPSDPAQPKVPRGSDQGFHGNVSGVAGSTTFNSIGCSGDKLNGLFFWNSRITPAHVRDGLSNTLAFAEIRVSPDVTSHDTRGRYWNNAFSGSVIISTLYPPNASVSDRLQWCQSIPAAPCTSGWDYIVQSARSAHPGGVVTAFADGSIQFVEDLVDPVTWKAFGTRAAND